MPGSWPLSAYLLTLFLGAALTPPVALYMWQRGTTPARIALTVWVAAIGQWCLCYLVALLSTDFATQSFWFRLVYIGGSITAAAVFVGGLQLAGLDHWVNRRTLLLLALEPAISWTLLATNDYHGLFWSTFQPDPGSFPSIAYERGVWGQVRLLYIYMLLAAGMAALVLTWRQQPELYRRQTILLLVSSLVPWIGTFLTVSGNNPLGKTDLTPGGFAVMVVVWAGAILRSQLFTIAPVARHRVIEEMQEAVIIFDTRGRIADANPAAYRLLGGTADAWLGKQANEALARWPQLVRQVAASSLPSVVTIELGTGIALRSIEFHSTVWNDAESPMLGHIVVAHDVTARRQVQELATLNAITEATNASLKVDEIARTLCTLLYDRVGIPVGRVYLYDGPTGALALSDAWGEQSVPEGEQPTVTPNQPTWSGTFWHQQPVVMARETEAGKVRRSISVPLLAQGEVLGMLQLESADETAFGAAETAFLGLVGQQVGAAIRNAVLYQEVDAARRQLQRLTEQLVDVQEAERRFLAAELHDEIGQSLTALQLALTLTPASAAIDAARLVAARKMVLELSGRVRQLSLDLRPAMLDDLGLLPALLWHFDRYTEQTDILVDFSTSGLERRFPPGVEIAAYRIVQEALTNVARYASVGEVRVQVWSDTAQLHVQIEDRGVGFNAALALASGKTGGLLGMRQRAIALRGQLLVESKAGRGVLINAELPLSQEGGSAHGHFGAAGG